MELTPREVPTKSGPCRLTQPPAAVKARVAARIVQCVQQVRAHFGRFVPLPTVAYDLRGTTAGQAFIPRLHVQFNPVLLVENEDDFVRTTVAHEVAHVATFVLFGASARPHGPEWKAVMRALGVPAERCHQYDVSSVRRARTAYAYRCACKVHHISAQRHARIIRGKVAFVCRRCKTPIRHSLA